MIGPGGRRVLDAGMVLYAAACAVIAFGSPELAVLFVGASISAGLVETGQSAHAAKLLEPASRGAGSDWSA